MEQGPITLGMGRIPTGYVLQEHLYTSARSVVSRVRPAHRDETVIIKQAAVGVPASVATARFQHEVEIRRDLDPEFALQVLAFHSDYLVLEDFGGVSLQSYLRDIRPPLVDCLRLACRLSRALASLHQVGILHRDVNPDNFIYNPHTGLLKINDFDLSSSLQSAGLCAPAATEGTLAYLAPEQSGRLNSPVGVPCDLYSLGVTLYQLFSGRRPFESDDPLRLLHCHLAVEAQPLHEVSPDIPQVLSSIVARLMAKSPSLRYQTATGLEADLSECWSQYRSDGRIEWFSPGRSDYCEKFELPDQLYGRESELNELCLALERCSTRGCQVALISGPSGVGKSSLVRQMMAQSGAYFGWGKFDQLRNEVPCSALMQALEQLISQLLGESEERIERWRGRIRRLENLPLLTASLPSLRLLVGPQPSPAPVDPSAAQGRFLSTFQEFIQLLASPEQPLVLFLDDLQWADALTVHLLSQLADSPDSQALLLVEAFRDEELADCPFRSRVEELRQRTQGVTSLSLQPLKTGEVLQLVADSLRRPPPEVRELGRLVSRKTEGNPFFVRQFLNSLSSDGHLAFDAELGGFRVDIEAVRRAAITENVADLLAHRLERLPVESRCLLMRAAALGYQFTQSSLVDVSGLQVLEHLQPVIDLGLLLPIAGRLPAYAFQHDRVQKAAYELLPESERPALHAEIGLRLLDQLGPEQLQERLFEVVSHLNRGQCKPEMSSLLGRLNSQAGDKAREAAAYDLACGFYATACHLLTDESEASYHVHYYLAESLRLSARVSEALEEAQASLGWVSDPRQRAQLETLRVVLYQSQGQMLAALESARRAFSFLGMDLTQEPEGLIARVLNWMEQGPIERLLDLPELDDPLQAALMEALTVAAPAAFQAERPLGVLIITQMVLISLENGNSRHSARAYCTFHQLLHSRGLQAEAYRFACAGRELCRKRGELFPRAAIEFLHAFFVAPWNLPWEEALQAFRHSFEYGRESGDYMHMAYAGSFEIFASLLAGPSLEELEQRAEHYLKVSVQLGEMSNVHNFQWLLTLLRQFRGDEAWNDAVSSQFLSNPMHEYYYHCLELQRNFFLEEYARADSVIGAMAPFIEDGQGCLPEVFYRIYGGLNAARTDQLKSLGLFLEWMQAQARTCPCNFSAPALLLEAETRRLDGQTLLASELYDQAIASAALHRFPVIEALANELAGDFWLGRNKSDFAALYLTRAHRLFVHWGALAKASRLEARHAAILLSNHSRSSTSVSNSLHSLNCTSLVRAAQVISGEIVLERLLSKLLQLLIENAGAQSGSLVLDQNGDWVVQALRVGESGPVTVMQNLPLAQADHLSTAIVNYVLRSGESLVLDDARLHAAFANEAYVRTRAPRSVLCFPIRYQGQLLGAVYLENNLLAGAFHQDRLTALEILLAQVGVSIENARLFAREREQAEAVTRLNEHLEELVAARTQELLDANARLREEAVVRERMESELRLAQKLQAVGQLAAGVAHEINSPMQFIQDNLEFVRLSCAEIFEALGSQPGAALADLREEVPSALSDALDGVRRVTAIVRAMKDFSYPDQSQKVLVDLNAAIENTLMVARNEYKLVADVVTDLHPLPQLLCYEGEINQIVLNLVVNAAHAIEEAVQETQQRGVITVATRVEPGAVEISVSDTGRGIPSEIQERIFDPFFTTKAVGRGSGQGLSISRSAVQRHGGQLTFQTAAGCGTTFTVQLPT